MSRGPGIERPFAGKTGPNGERLCVMCGKTLSGRKQSWCSAECVAVVMMRHQGFARRQVEKRDHGICAICGIDPRDRHGPLLPAHDRFDAKPYWTHQRTTKPDGSVSFERVKIIPEKPKGRFYASRLDDKMRRWEADHIVPLVEGGGYGLDNLRTLCSVPCHAAATKALAARRAAKRRATS